MPDRDATWSEYLRRTNVSPTVQRLLTWVKRMNVAGMNEPVAKELVVLLSLVLTTVVRNDRDLATRALVLIGERYPAVLFRHVLKTLRFNDPYVSERVLAAAYGVMMSLVNSSAATKFRPLLGSLAEALYRNMFAPRARYATHHCLMRDYSLGIIQLALRKDCVRLAAIANCNLTEPYPNTPTVFSDSGPPQSSVIDAIGHAIQMDFGNYTIGKLIPNRANYDDKNPEYVRVRSQIERRIYDLGYRKAQFEAIDREIGRISFPLERGAQDGSVREEVLMDRVLRDVGRTRGEEVASRLARPRTNVRLWRGSELSKATPAVESASSGFVRRFDYQHRRMGGRWIYTELGSSSRGSRNEWAHWALDFA